MDILRTIVTTTASVVTWELLKRKDKRENQTSLYRNIKIKKELMDEFSASCEKAGVDEGFQLKKLITDFNDKVASQG